MGAVELHEYQMAALFVKVLHCTILYVLTVRGKEQITPYRQNPPNHMLLTQREERSPRAIKTLLKTQDKTLLTQQ